MIKSKDDLIKLLRFIISNLEINDSFEGRISYEQIDSDNYNCDYAIRYGNSLGQGGVLIPEYE